MKTWSTLPKCICYHQECNSNSVLMLFKFQSCSSCSSLLSSWLRTSSAKEETAETAEKIVTTLKSCGDLVDFHLLSKWPYFYVCWKNLPGTYPIHQKKNTKYILKGKKGKCQEFELTSVNVKLTIEWYISKKNTTNVIFLVLLQKLNLKWSHSLKMQLTHKLFSLARGIARNCSAAKVGRIMQRGR